MFKPLQTRKGPTEEASERIAPPVKRFSVKQPGFGVPAEENLLLREKLNLKSTEGVQQVTRSRDLGDRLTGGKTLFWSPFD